MIFNACQKNEIATIENETILKFKNVEEYQSELKTVLSLDLEQLRQYETSKGYASLGRIADEFYEKIDFDEFKSQDELISFINNHSKYLELVQEDGEYYLETKFTNNVNRYFINEDKMFIIGNSVYKIFDNEVAITNVDNIKKLKNISTITELKNNEGEIYFSGNFENIQLKDNAYNCGTNGVARATKKRDRTKIEISIDYLFTYDAYGNKMTIYQNRILVRPYKKTLGVWYWCKRTLSCDIKIANDYLTANGWARAFYYKHENGKYASKLEYIIDGGVISNEKWITLPLHYGGYDCWADTPSTSTANLECNTSLF